MLPEFRKHLKTSNMLGKLFASLEDAPEFHDLEVVDVNEHFLNLLANLLKLKPSLENELIPPYLKIVERSADQLWLKLEQFNNYKCHVKEESNTYQLALDSLLNLPSECFTPWFKHLLHKNGIFGHIIDVIEKLCRSLNYGILEHSDNKLFQFLQILANTSEDEETQHLLLMYEDGKLADSLIKLCQICNEAIVENPIFNSTSSTGISANILLVVLKVLIALTHNYDNKSEYWVRKVASVDTTSI
ncbi:hypothetical protein C0J52_12341 [Blattella germanica]|nr:hypothetical protein C0J52_12341 [Blattella germanica]